MQPVLQDRRILVPASRVGRNVLADLLVARGATVILFPDLEAAPPSDTAALDAAVDLASRCAWIVFSGEPSVVHFFLRPGAAALVSDPGFSRRVVALGIGTARTLKDRGIRPAHAPRAHQVPAVVEQLGNVARKTVLLIREESAEAALPRALRDAGGDVVDVAGYRLLLRADDRLLRRAFGVRPDLIAFANPTAARVLARSFEELSLDREHCLGGVPIAAVGPATAEAARRYGFAPDLVAPGRLASLLGEIVARWRRP